MLVIALCTACFSRAKINKNRWPPYFECSGAGSGSNPTSKGRHQGAPRKSENFF